MYAHVVYVCNPLKIRMKTNALIDLRRSTTLQCNTHWQAMWWVFTRTKAKSCQNETRWKLFLFSCFISQNKHGSVRHVINRTISQNKGFFNPFFTPSSNIKDLCEQNWKSGIWATQVEVIAAATVFRVPIYFISLSTTGMWFVHWIMNQFTSQISLMWKLMRTVLYD